jgi:hypothetical protein
MFPGEVRMKSTGDQSKKGHRQNRSVSKAAEKWSAARLAQEEALAALRLSQRHPEQAWIHGLGRHFLRSAGQRDR